MSRINFVCAVAFATCIIHAINAERYCSDDLKGYYQYATNNNKTFIECPSNTRCSCYFRQKCVMPVDSICSQNASPFPSTLSFSLVTKGTGIETRNGKVSRIRHEQTNIYQDGQTKMLSKKEIGKTLQSGISTSFEILKMDINGNYTEVKSNIGEILFLITSHADYGSESVQLRDLVC